MCAMFVQMNSVLLGNEESQNCNAAVLALIMVFPLLSSWML